MKRLWIVLDALTVVIFVLIGRSTHHHGLRVGGVVSTTWPFALGLALGWLFLERRRRSGSSVRGGVVVLLFTVIVGMALRVVAGQGTAVAFICVAFGFLGLLMLGLRFVAETLRRQRRRRLAR